MEKLNALHKINSFPDNNNASELKQGIKMEFYLSGRL